MEIKATVKNRRGEPFDMVYRDIDSESDFEGKKIRGIRAFCFYKGKLVIVHESAGHWNLPGGGIEDGENPRTGIEREIREEANMRVLKLRFTSLHESVDEGVTYHYGTVVCLVKPYGDFISDPGNEVTEIKLIDPNELFDHITLNWGQIRDRIYQRALEARGQMENEIGHTTK